MLRPTTLLALALALCAHRTAVHAQQPDPGVLPTDAAGAPLNLDFETGTLKDWTAEGSAFDRQPIEGDAVRARRNDMRSRHVGRYWVGTYEREGDAPQGTLTSVPFKATHPWATFLVAGGISPATCVEVVRKDGDRLIARFAGEISEEMRRVAVDLGPHQGREIYVRLVDKESGGWGHLNFDDFRFHATKPNVSGGAPLDAYQHAGLPPEKSAEVMTLPPGFKATLFAGEPDVHQPIAFTIDDRGRLWVAEAYSYPIKVAKGKARDRILIFEDKDGDGKFDSKKVFTEGLNLVSGMEIGFGGVWVGAAPELLFIPDKDGDDRPDGPPVALLDGWGSQDTHETLNTFNWGPDGWLYGCHGVFTRSKVGKPGTPDAERTPINAGIWRYHPTKHRFEVFAHGTSNPWGVDFNDLGQAFLTSCVIPHLYHVIQGARYERQAGPHFNPYTYDDIKTIADHRHYVGGNPHAGNGRSDTAGGGHAHSGAMIYLGGHWPAPYRGQMFMNNIHGARINEDLLVPSGSGYVGKHAPDFLLANDRWSQILNLRYGPDGNVYMIDWYDGEQCHLTDPNRHDRSNGRIFKISYGDGKPVKVDLRSLPSEELVKLQSHPNDWYARVSRRLLQERGADPKLEGALADLAFKSDKEPLALRGLWALHATGNLSEGHLKTAFARGGHVAAWAVQLATEDGKASPATLATFADMARSSGSPVVRLYLASAAQKLPAADRWPILSGLLAHGEDATDQNLPLMDWYAIEPLATVDAKGALGLALEGKIPTVRDFMIRRIGAIGTPQAIALLVETMGTTDRPELRLALLSGLNESLKGRRQVEMPPVWPKVAETLLRSGDSKLRSQALALALTFGDVSALSALREVLSDNSADLALRREALAAMLKVKAPDLAPVLQDLIARPELRGQALKGLASMDHPKTPEVILAAYKSFNADDRRDALNTLASRPAFARALVAAVEAKSIPPADLSADLIRQLRNLGDGELTDRVGKVWGQVRDTSADRVARIADYRARITKHGGTPPDPSHGRAVFAKACQQCHTLFGVGSKVGPELTGSNRRDLTYVLENVLDPSALIGKDYLAHVVATTDGRTLTGIIRSEDKDAITLVTANETVVVPKAEVEERKPSTSSMMPEDLWTNLPDADIRALVAYLASPAQVPMLATTDNVAGMFNGRDLTGWQGDASVWSVKDGEIVGETTQGLAHNTWLRSDLLLRDFRLTLQIKLVGNEGNSGIQFRSQVLPDDEVKGYQADAGPGWWGKLYEEHGRALLWDRSGEAHIKPGDWNTYEITAVGSKILTKINGKVCVDLDDPAGARAGITALQLHSGGPTEVRFKDFKLELKPKPEMSR